MSIPSSHAHNLPRLRVSSRNWNRRALNISVRHQAVLGANAANVERVLSRLEETGLPRTFLLRRFVPPEVSRAFSKDSNTSSGHFASELLSRAKRVFGWDGEDLLGAAPLSLGTRAVATARFKVRRRRSDQRVSAYTVYAHYLAMLVLKATEHLPVR